MDHGRFYYVPRSDRHASFADYGRHRGLYRRHCHVDRAATGWIYPARGPGDDLWNSTDASRFDAGVHQLQEHRSAGDRHKTIDGVNSVSALAGYEVLTEGRGSNAGTCLINLRPWSEPQDDVEADHLWFEHKCRTMTNVKLEFFEPPAVPGFGAAGGVSCRVLDRTNTMNYKRLGEETEKFLAALNKRKELKSIFTFFASNYPQYELVINNDVAMQKGVSIKDAMDNLSIVIGSTGSKASFGSTSSTRSLSRPCPSSGDTPRILKTSSSRTIRGTWSPTLLS